MARRALVIGPADYTDDSGLEGYPTIRESARMYGEVLPADPMWGRDSCRVLDDSEVETVHGVMNALEETAAATRRGDTLLVVYIGHGLCWSRIPDDEVHFAVGSSNVTKPWTCLSSWYVNHVINKAEATLKVLIADCCYSNRLPSLGGEIVLPGVLGRRYEGTCKFTALRRDDNDPVAPPEGCSALEEPLARCTPFSGHLLDVLKQGTQDPMEQLTLGWLRETVKYKMETCRTGRHRVPEMTLRDAPDGTPLFTNKVSPEERVPSSEVPSDPNEWIKFLRQDPASHLDKLLNDERMAGVVAGRLAKSDEDGQEIARLINRRANEVFRSSHNAFVRFSNRMDRESRA